MYTWIKVIEMMGLYFYNNNKCIGTKLLRPLA